MLNNKIKEILNKGELTHSLNKQEIIYLLKTKDEELNLLYQVADRVREKYMGDTVYLRGIIEFSNYCLRNCKYCGLRRDNRNLKRYRLSLEEIVKMAEDANKLGYKTIVLQSGEDNYYDQDKIGWIIKEIKSKVDTAITLCLGERDYEEYKCWKECGADRYLLRHETANNKLYQKLHPAMELKDRIKRLKWLKELGYQIGSGNLIGLAGQTLDMIADDIILFKKFNLDMLGLGPFIANPHTPLKNNPNGSVELTLKTIAISRIILPLTHIPATTALGSIDPQGRQKALKVGANIVMPNVTVGEYRKFYELYPHKICIKEEPNNCRQCIGGIISSLNRVVGTGYGHSLVK